MKSRTFVLILLVCQAARAAEVPQNLTIADLRDRTDGYVEAMRNLKTEIEVVRVSRLSSGRLSETTFSVECLMRDYTMRQSRYAKAVIDGNKKWFDIRETLVLAAGGTAEWRHPGFPGQISFGESSDQISLIRNSACEIGDPFYVLKRIRRSLGRDSAHIVKATSDKIIVRVDVDESDYLEFEFSAEFDWLPILMTRICQGQKKMRAFNSGGFFSIDYERQKSGDIVPTKATRFSNLKEDIAGTLTTSWKFSEFDTAVTPTDDQMAITLPLQTLSANMDTEEQQVIQEKNDKVAADLKNRFGNLIRIEDRITAMKCVSASFVGRCPDLPPQYRDVATRPLESIGEASSVNWNVALLVLHALGVLGVGIYFRRRKYE